MALTVSTLVSEVGDAWRSYVREQPPSTALTSSMDADDLTFTVSDSIQVSKGLVEIDDEMVHVKSVDKVGMSVTLEPWGRGLQGSTAVSHSPGARITVAPQYPRSRIRDVVSSVLQEIFPNLFGVTSVLLDMNPAKVRYDLPADAYHVLNVEFNPPGPSLAWVPVKRWRQSKTPTGLAVEIYSRVTPGEDRARVFYIKNPPAQLAFTDDLEAMGYPLSVRSVIIPGACAYLATFTETSRVQTGPLESVARAEVVPAGSSTGLARFLYQLYRQRLEDETRNQQLRYPVTLHFTR